MKGEIKVFGQKQQQGSILLISLMLLIVLTLLTFSSSKSVILQEKMVAGSRDGIVALEAAGIVLNEAKNTVNANAYQTTGSAGGFYDGSNCNGDVSDTACTHLTALADLFSESTWVKSTPVNTEVKCINGTSTCNITGKYIVVYLGERNISFSSDDSHTVISSDTVEVNTAGAAGSEKSNLYKIIAKASGLNSENERVIISYYASED